MPNERLRTRITAAGLTLEDLAAQVEVDPKTVERWITTDRVPHRRHRQATAALLGADEVLLWPSLAGDAEARSGDETEFVGLFPHRGAVPQDLWTTLLHDVQDGFDMLVYAGLFLLDANPDLPRVIAEKAGRGARIRLLFGDPSSEAVRQRGHEEGIGDGLSARIRISLSYLRELFHEPGIEIRFHETILYNSIYRFDDELLANVHAYGSPAPHNPVLHLRRAPGGRIFDHYMNSFDRVWAGAVPVSEHQAGA